MKIGLALTWDGARWPVKNLPAKAKAFLSGKAVPSRKSLAALFANNQVEEVRVCWVPRLKGGPDVLGEPFSTTSGKRIAYRSAKVSRFDDILGVVYRKA